MPERIRENREPYYAALRAADQKWNEGQLDVHQLASYLEELLKAQLQDDDPPNCIEKPDALPD